MFTTTDVKFDELESTTVMGMDEETRACVKIEEVDEIDVLPMSMESTSVASMVDLAEKVHVKIEEGDEMDVPPTSMVGAFAENFFPEWCPKIIKEEELLEDPLPLPDGSKYCKAELDKTSEENGAMSKGVSSTEYAGETTSMTAGSSVLTKPLDCSNGALGLKTHISAVLGGLLNRALNDGLESTISRGDSGHLPALSQPTQSLPQKVAAHRPAPSSTSQSTSKGPRRRVYNTELAKRALRQLNSRRGRMLLHVAAGPADASRLRSYSCFYCESRFRQRSTWNAHMVHAHTYYITTIEGPPRRVLRRGLQPRSSWIVSENHGLLQRTVLQKVHNELEMSPDKLMYVDTCGAKAEQTTLQEDNLNCSADYEKLTDDTFCKFTCSSCQMTFSSKYSLIMHVFIHIEGVGPPSHICRSCGNVYVTDVGLNNHLKMHECDIVHEAGKLYKCYVCHKSFVKAAYLKAHERVHSGSRSHKCHICGKSFLTASLLKRHALIHSGIKPHKCDVCGNLFTSVGGLKSHARIHSGVRPHRCFVCGKLFARAGDLKAHALIHSGVKPHKCSVCGKPFLTASLLKRHAVIHSGIKLHKCGVCSKTFLTTALLKSHALTHSGVRPHKCDVCGKSFGRAHYLKRHRLVHPKAKLQQ